MSKATNTPRAFAFCGDVKTVCAILKSESERCKGMTVEQYIRYRVLEEIVSRQIAEIEARHRAGARQRRE